MSLAIPGTDPTALRPAPRVQLHTPARNGPDTFRWMRQRPAGVSAGTLAIWVSVAKNAACLAARSLGLHDAKIRTAVEKFRARQTKTVVKQELP